MEKIFPNMCSKPEKVKVILIAIFWPLLFVLLPMYMPFIGLGIWEQQEISVWLEIGYHVANCILMLFLIGGYLKEEWFMVTADKRFYLKHIILTVGLMVVAELGLLGAMSFYNFNTGYALEGLPVVEMIISHTPCYTVTLEPVFGTIALSVIVPINICALFYCLGFAPVCYKKPWLAYLCIIFLTLIPPVVNILWRGEAEFYLCVYLAHLPIHLLACWSYQKTDNVWTPLVSLWLMNLLTSVIQILLFQ